MNDHSTTLIIDPKPHSKPMIKTPKMYYEGAMSETCDYQAPDGSHIWLLSDISGAGLALCSLPPHATSCSFQHKTVEEIWHFTNGRGEVGRKNYDGKSEFFEVSQGVSIIIYPGLLYQFRNTEDVPLQFFIVTSPPWPGPQEAILSDIEFWPSSFKSIQRKYVEATAD